MTLKKQFKHNQMLGVQVDVHLTDLQLRLHQLDITRMLNLIAGMASLFLRMDNYPPKAEQMVLPEGARAEDQEEVLAPSASSTPPLTIINIVIDQWAVDIVPFSAPSAFTIFGHCMQANIVMPPPLRG